MSEPETKGSGTRIVPAPIPADTRLQPTILDVVCGLDEEVEWHWRMTEHGALVSGYSIIRRGQNNKEAERWSRPTILR